ncbi:MAG: class I SAM-dependent methyltransferase [Candidatus Jordarchaeum sp.]|uniref:class I SAM-dependent methyltransferase n=1 Tax=Candidatus Jordarchaeum sp. TaxID=2823881 RepID=UPI0040498EA4
MTISGEKYGHDENQFKKLLQQLILPPKQHPRFKIIELYHLTGVNRGNLIVSLFRGRLEINKLKVLDVGCGSGGVSIAFARNGARVVSIDVNGNCTKITKVRACEEKVLIDVSNTDACNTPFRDEVFDILVCNDVVEHISNINKFFLEIGRLLKAGGVIFIETHNKLSPYIILSDPHSGLPFVVLLPKRIADPIVWRWGRIKNSLYYNATYLDFIKKLSKNGIEIFFVDLSVCLKAAKTLSKLIPESSFIHRLLVEIIALLTPLIDFWIRTVHLKLLIPGWRLIGKKKRGTENTFIF